MSWQVVRQVPDQIKNDITGNTVTGVVVHFVTGLQQPSSVFIEDTAYSDAAAVKQAIDVKAAIVDQVAQLTSDSTTG
jgi:hypothetical protein